MRAMCEMTHVGHPAPGFVARVSSSNTVENERADDSEAGVRTLCLHTSLVSNE